MKDEPIWVLFYPANDPKAPVHMLLAPAPEGGLLKTMQTVVGGYIEVIRHPDNEKLLIVCDEEGKMKDKDFNRPICVDGEQKDVICGDFFICREDGEDMVSLTEEDFDWLLIEDTALRSLNG